MGYTILRDTREQKGWNFTPNAFCDAVKDATLKTGDYTLEGLEDVFTIERKGCTAELATNLVEQRFEDELIRLDKFPHSFIVLEFTLDDIINFPKNSGIPPKLWCKVKTKPYFLLKQIVELEIAHKPKIIFAGKHGRDVASSIFKRMTERYPNEVKRISERTRKNS